MIEYITYKANGEILGNGKCPESMLELQGSLGDGIFVMRSDAAWSGNYVDDAGFVVKMPARPSGHHVFDYVQKAWTDPRALDELKVDKWREIRAARDAAEFGGFEWDGSRFDSDAVSQSRIRGAATSAAMEPGFFTKWTLADNTVRALDATDMAAVCAALGAHVDAQHARARGLRAQIDAAANAEQLEKLMWEAE